MNTSNKRCRVASETLYRGFLSTRFAAGDQHLFSVVVCEKTHQSCVTTHYKGMGNAQALKQTQQQLPVSSVSLNSSAHSFVLHMSQLNTTEMCDKEVKESDGHACFM